LLDADRDPTEFRKLLIQTVAELRRKRYRVTQRLIAERLAIGERTLRSRLRYFSIDLKRILKEGK
jgi:hypothetical protein